MHLVKVWDVSLYKKKSSGLFLKSTKEACVKLPNMLSGVIHCEAWKYYLFGSKGDISEGHKNLQDIFTKLVLILYILVEMILFMT